MTTAALARQQRSRVPESKQQHFKPITLHAAETAVAAVEQWRFDRLLIPLHVRTRAAC